MKKTQKIKFHNYDYDIIKCDKTNYYEDVRTSKTILKEKFLYLPIIHNKKLHWLKKHQIRYRLSFMRYTKFDDGWTYKGFWSGWLYSFIIDDII
jgi:hypothetical protein